MGVFYSTEELPNFKHPVITIGTFDGVHMGHKTILRQVADMAKAVDGTSILVTFHPHPRKVVFPNKPMHILTPLEEKIALVNNEGIEHVIVAPFTKEFAQCSAEEYVNDFLVKQIRPHTIVIGYDHQFGHDRKGNIELLEQLSAAGGYQVKEIPAQMIQDAAVSSTKVRTAIQSGDVADAADMLERYYTLRGKVTKGAQLGNTIGYPTANILPNDAEQIIPAMGVYAVTVEHSNNTYKGMLNIGVKPTVSEEQKLTIEVNIFNFDQDIYNEELNISFVSRLRAEQKFNSLDELKAQLAKDKEQVLQVLA